MFGKIKLLPTPLSKLELDINNPRLIGYRKQGKINKENDIIPIMLSLYGVKDLIFSILTNGYHPDEVLYSIPNENKNKKIIVEGNRRLTACKIIKKPEILKHTTHSNLINRIKNHKNYLSALDTINRLNVIDLPNRAMARTYIASKHTKESIKRWSVYTQGAYYIDLLNEYNDINTLRASINNSVSSSRIRGVILFSRLTDAILELPTLNDLEKERLLLDIDSVKVEAIIRLTQRSDFKEKIAKISLNKTGDLLIRDISKDAFQLILAKLTRDANFSKELSTRQENDKKIHEYLNDLIKLISEFEKPTDSSKDELEDEEFDIDLNDENSTDINEDQNENQDSNEDDNASSIKPDANISSVKKPKKPMYLISRSTKYVGHEKIDALIYEAMRMNTVNFKYSSVLLSRTLIETILILLIKRSSLHDSYKIFAKFNYLQLDNLLDYFSSNLIKIFPEDDNKPVIKLIKHTLKSYKDTGKMIANLATHNDEHSLTEHEVEHVRAKLNDLTVYFLPKIMAGQ